MEHKTLWFPTYAQALTYTKNKSLNSSDALLGLEATTPLSWLDDKWGLWGSGEVLVSTSQRVLLVEHLIKNYPILVSSTNTYVLLARFFSQVIGIPAFRKAQANPPASLSEAELAVLNLAADYEAALASRSLIEQGTALFALPDFAFAGGISFGAFCTLPICYQEALKARGISLEMPINPIQKLTESVEPKFVFSAGKSVQTRLLFEEIVAEVTNEAAQPMEDSTLVGKVLLVHPKPYEFFRNTASSFAERNISTAVIAYKKFSETSFGKGFLALTDYVFSTKLETTSMVDFLLSSISGISERRAFELDALWRANRIISHEEQVALVMNESPTLEYLVELFNDADASIVLGYIEDFLKKSYGSRPTFLNEQLSALETLRSLYNAARLYELDPAEFIPLLETISISSPFSTTEGMPDVVITSLNKAASYGPGSFQTVIACSLDSETYQASEDHNATITLMQKLGIESSLSRLAIMRHQFGTIQTCAQKQFICERILNKQGNELYPAFFWDEYVSLYREDEKDKHFQDLPATLCSNIVEAGEEGLSENLILSTAETNDVAFGGNVSNKDALKEALVKTRVIEGKPLPVLSPSAIESYINCPYRWFFERKLGTENLDEGFSAIEKGNVAHKTFELFFKHLEEHDGITALSKIDFEYATSLLDTIFEEVRENQPKCDPLSGRLVPVDTIETFQVDKLKESLKGCLENQLSLPTEYVPAHHEYTIKGFEEKVSFHDAASQDTVSQDVASQKASLQDAPAQPVIYAGAVLNGRVDRIDFSEDGQNFAVIDYKGGIKGHNAGMLEDCFNPEEFTVPHKLQALIYASALKQVFPDKKPSAALYLSYNAKTSTQFLAGSYNPASYNAEDISHKDSRVEINFESYLNLIENYAEQRISEMVAGNIEPKPLCKESCEYCPVANCEKRWTDGD